MIKELKMIIKAEVNKAIKKNTYKKKVFVDETKVTEVQIGKQSY